LVQSNNSKQTYFLGQSEQLLIEHAASLLIFKIDNCCLAS
jgi:hypothetical protein